MYTDLNEKFAFFNQIYWLAWHKELLTGFGKIKLEGSKSTFWCMLWGGFLKPSAEMYNTRTFALFKGTCSKA